MAPFQVWLVHVLSSDTPVKTVMRMHWGWPAAESLHFIGLSLLVGCIGAFDLRLLGVGKRIPIAALHKLIPWGLIGFAINLLSGLSFLMTEPDQYIYNPSFHFKLLFMAIAGLNASAFYAIAYRRTTAPGAPADAPGIAKVIAAISLCAWIAVIICGRLLTFYRPGACPPAGAGFLATCIPSRGRP
jgi:hypothetical protein